MLRTYALAPNTIRRFLRRTFWRFQAIALVSFLGFGGYLVFTAGTVHWNVAGPLIGVISLAYFLIIFFNLRQQLRALYALRYEIDGSSIVFRQPKQVPVHISRASITRVAEKADGLKIETNTPSVSLFVPYGLAREGDADFNSTLATWVTVEPRDSSHRLERWLWIAGAGVALLVLLFANHLWVIVPFGFLLLAFGIYTENWLRKKRDVPFATVRMFNMAFSFLVVVIGVKICLLGVMLLSAR